MLCFKQSQNEVAKKLGKNGHKYRIKSDSMFGGAEKLPGYIDADIWSFNDLQSIEIVPQKVAFAISTLSKADDLALAIFQSTEQQLKDTRQKDLATVINELQQMIENFNDPILLEAISESVETLRDFYGKMDAKNRSLQKELGF